MSLSLIISAATKVTSLILCAFIVRASAGGCVKCPPLVSSAAHSCCSHKGDCNLPDRPQNPAQNGCQNLRIETSVAALPEVESQTNAAAGLSLNAVVAFELMGFLSRDVPPRIVSENILPSQCPPASILRI